jgi:enoyl-CoA hydratase/carnithine racemase
MTESEGRDDVLLEQEAPGIGILRLNRPQRRNAMTRSAMRRLHALIEDAGRDPSIRAVILTGTGRGFCAGLDISGGGIDPGGQAPDVSDYYELQEVFAGSVKRLRALDKPVIAAINGAAVGAGFALALAADIRIATPSASFHVGAVKIGLSAGECGISYHLPRLLGASRAFELMLTGRPVDADEAERIGLVSALASDKALMDEAHALAGRIIENSPYAIKHTKQIMWANLDAQSLDAALELENRTQVLALMTRDFAEALAAFNEKRRPEFTGR